MKFPQALAVAYITDLNGESLGSDVKFGTDIMREDTYSPMAKKYGFRPMELSREELLRWSLQESDNNACDVLFTLTDGPAGTEAILNTMGIGEGITIGATEDDMYNDKYLSYLNRTTPIAMASLFREYDITLRQKSASFDKIGEIIENCRTGADRLAAPLKNSPAILGHKTGTGFMLDNGRLMAINDCGYVHLPDGQNYAIAVFIADSAYGMDETSGIIAEISRIVYNAVAR